MIWIFGFIVAIVLLIVGKFCFKDEFGGGRFNCQFLAVIFIIISLIATIGWTFNYLEYDSRTIKYHQTRAVLVDELHKYDTMRSRDVAGSSSYLELREKVLDFNYNVYKAKQIDSFLLDNLVIDPAYRAVEPIPIDVG